MRTSCFSSARTLVHTVEMLIQFICLFACLFAKVSSVGDQLLGPGIWDVLYVEDCEDEGPYDYQAKVVKFRLDRTHEAFSINLTLPGVINVTSHMLSVKICKMSDGVCKPYQEFNDECACCMINKYARKNFEKALEMMNVEPLDCPIPAGEYYLPGYDFNYCELPKKSLYGEFRAYSYFLNPQGEVEGCVKVVLLFEECGECDQCPEEDDQ